MEFITRSITSLLPFLSFTWTRVIATTLTKVQLEVIDFNMIEVEPHDFVVHVSTSNLLQVMQPLFVLYFYKGVIVMEEDVVENIGVEEKGRDVVVEGVGLKVEVIDLEGVVGLRWEVVVEALVRKENVDDVRLSFVETLALVILVHWHRVVSSLFQLENATMLFTILE